MDIYGCRLGTIRTNDRGPLGSSLALLSGLALPGLTAGLLPEVNPTAMVAPAANSQNSASFECLAPPLEWGLPVKLTSLPLPQFLLLVQKDECRAPGEQAWPAGSAQI